MSPQINKGNTRQSKVCLFPAVIVGSGMAGLIAAIKLAKNNIEVAVITKKGAGKASNTAYSMGLFTCSGNKMDKEKHFNLSLEAGEMINQKDLLKKLVDNAPEAFNYFIKELNMELDERENGFVYNKGEIIIPGANITTKLTEIAKNLGVNFYTHHLPVEILTDNGHCKGLITLDEKNNPVFFKTNNLLLASGGFGGAFKNTDNPPTVKGEGMILAYRAGASLKDLEFVQFFPLGLRDDRLPSFIAPPMYPKNAKIINNKGENLIEKHLGKNMDLNTATQRNRDKLSIALEQEWQESEVFMDMTECSGSEWNNLNSTPIYEKFNFNFDKEKFLVGPTAHHTMGGIMINDNLDTGVKGLYAAGEIVGGLHGANRLGGNALTETIVFGLEAADKIQNSISEAASAIKEAEKITCKNPLAAMLFTSGLDSENSESNHSTSKVYDLNIKEYENKLNNLFNKTLSPIRDEELLKTGLKEAKKIRKEILNLAVDVREKDLKKLITLEMTAQLLELASFSALLRTESRGGHYRVDYPETINDFDKSICWHNDKYFYDKS